MKHIEVLAHRQTMSPSSMALPRRAPAPAPMMVPNVFEPPGAMT
jgi:hypothetical protein